jgi:transcriptional regulator with XRE-family HTH domain
MSLSSESESDANKINFTALIFPISLLCALHKTYRRGKTQKSQFDKYDKTCNGCNPKIPYCLPRKSAIIIGDSMIGTLIQTNRTKKGMSLGVLAERAGINKSTLSRWESGKTKPNVHELVCVLDVLDTPDQLRRQCLQLLNQPRSERHLSKMPARELPDATLPVSGGELLQALRVRAGFTQADAARIVGVTQSLLSRWEHNECWPETEILYLLCQTLRATQGEYQGLRERAWKNHEELPLDKEELDIRLHRLRGDDRMTERDLIYLAFAGRYRTLHRQRKISDLEAMEAWGSYAYHLTGLGRIKEAIHMAQPVFQAIHRSTGVLTQGQYEGLVATTDNLTKGKMPEKKYFPTREILLRFEDRIAPSLLGRWQDDLGMISWHCGRTSNLPEVIAQSDAYYEQAAQSETTPAGQWRRYQRFAGVICFQKRYEDTLRQLERSATLPQDTRIGPQITYVQLTAWALAGLGDSQTATYHLNQANNLLAANPEFIDRPDRIKLSEMIACLIEKGIDIT